MFAKFKLYLFLQKKKKKNRKKFVLRFVFVISRWGKRARKIKAKSAGKFLGSSEWLGGCRCGCMFAQ